MLKMEVASDPNRVSRWQTDKDKFISCGTKSDDCTWGKWKLECKDIVESIHLGSKLYVYKFAEGAIHMKTKGLRKQTHKDIRFDRFRQLLQNPLQTIHAVNTGFTNAGALMLSSRSGRTISGLYLKRMFSDSNFNETHSYELQNLRDGSGRDTSCGPPPTKRLNRDDHPTTRRGRGRGISHQRRGAAGAKRGRGRPPKAAAAANRGKVYAPPRGPTRQERKIRKRTTDAMGRISGIFGPDALPAIDNLSAMLGKGGNIIIIPHVQYMTLQCTNCSDRTVDSSCDLIENRE